MKGKNSLVEKIKEVAERLSKVFPEPYKPSRTPVEQLVFTILSQNTTDRNAERCLENLRKLTGGNLFAITALDRNRVISAIRTCGMYNQKYTALVSILKDWRELEKKIPELDVDEAVKLLTSYPYIGSKTARVVLTFAFGKNTFPIDTHCRRVLNRLGIFPKDWSKNDISKFMEENFSAEFNRKLHYDLIRLGRSVCRARKPDCKICPLRSLCSYALSTFTK